MYEVELKVPASGALETVRKRLEARGAEHLGAVVQEDTYYDAPHRTFAETDEALRVRRETIRGDHADEPGGESRLTYKGPLVEAASKTRTEHETAVDDGEAVHAALTKLGFEPAAVVRKERDRYALSGYTITLDAVDDAGEFVEVEADAAEEADIDAVREGAIEVLERLGLDPEDQLRTSYLELVIASREE